MELDTFYFEDYRWAQPGTGKSDGVRIIYYNRCEESGRIYLALLYSKNEADNLTYEQKTTLKKVAVKLA